MSELTLYTSEICPYAARTRILVELKNIPYKHVELEFDNKPDWFLQLTPAQRVPVIEHEGHILWESAIINEYLDAKFDGMSLMPHDEAMRAMIRIEIRHFDQVFLPIVYKCLFEQDPSEQIVQLKNVTEAVEFLEQRLGDIQQGDGPYWFGDAMTMADLNMFPFMERFEVFNHYRNMEIPAHCTRLRRWFETVSNESAFKKIMHDLDWYIPRYVGYAGGTAQGLSAQAFRSGAAN